jgi:hypothetical protein
VRIGVLSAKAVEDLNNLNKNDPNYTENVKTIFKEEFKDTIPENLINELFNDNTAERLVATHLEFREKEGKSKELSNSSNPEISAAFGLSNTEVKNSSGNTIDSASGVAQQFGLNIPITEFGENRNSIDLSFDVTKAPQGVSFANADLEARFRNALGDFEFKPSLGLSYFKPTPERSTLNYVESKDNDGYVAPKLGLGFEKGIGKGLSLELDTGFSSTKNGDVNNTNLGLTMKKDVTTEIGNLGFFVEGFTNNTQNNQEGYDANTKGVSAGLTFTLE